MCVCVYVRVYTCITYTQGRTQDLELGGRKGQREGATQAPPLGLGASPQKLCNNTDRNFIPLYAFSRVAQTPHAHVLHAAALGLSFV